jgi:hypothetical protein
MTERELDMQLAKERQLKSYADDQDNIDEESSGEDGVDDDSWQHRPSAHSRLIEMLKMEQPEAGFYDDEQSTSELFAAEDTLDDNSDDEKNDDSYYEKDDEDDSSGSSSAISEDEQTDEAAKPSDGEELEYCESEYSSVESGQGAWNIENDVLNGGNDSMHSVANEYEAYQRQFNNPDSDGQSEFSAAVEARKSKQFNPISSLKDNLCGQITVQRLLSYGEDNSPSQLPQELIQYSIKNRLLNGWEKVTNSAGFSPLQSRVFPYLANYQDLLMVSHQRSIDSKASGTGAEIMQSYVLHALNHIFM